MNMGNQDKSDPHKRPRGRFDRFNEGARKALSLAQEEARKLQHHYIGTEHLLLGLIREGEGVAAQVLQKLGVDLSMAQESIEYIIGRGDRRVLGQIGLTPRSKKIIELAVDEARLLNHHYVGTEHLLLGIVREGEGIAAGVLFSLGVNLEDVRTNTLQVLNQTRREQEKRVGDEGNKVDLKADGPGEAGKQSEPATQAGAEQRGPVQDEDDRVPPPGAGGPMERFDKFTIRARRVLMHAEEVAKRLHHNYIGTEHLLLGLIQETGGIAAYVLENLGVERQKILSAIEFILSRQQRSISVITDIESLGLTLRGRRVIELAVDEARRLKHHYVGTEHLLLGLIREGEGIAAEILESLGVNLEKTRRETIRLLGQ